MQTSSQLGLEVELQVGAGWSDEWRLGLETEETAELTPTLLVRASLQYLTQETFAVAPPWHTFAMTTTIFQQKTGCPSTEIVRTKVKVSF